ncbi:hypothetical protein KIW84_022483 [Lathyrus oleraceus]|uniref:Pentatricopeptide repeat-containing protein n=1 Tax=Pisum sativum TaxID=3888 RepID=A0A9D5BAT5_PEA|nr:hypothetical protein KIW84_022483 [Pisum sativum]
MGGFVRRKKIRDARRLFDKMPFRMQFTWNTMILGYAQVRGLSRARRLFDESPIRDVYTWITMVSGYMQNRMLDEARIFFDDMPQKNEVSYKAAKKGEERKTIQPSCRCLPEDTRNRWSL